MAVRRLRGQEDPLVQGTVDHLEQQLQPGSTIKMGNDEVEVKMLRHNGQDLMLIVQMPDGGMDQVRITTSRY